MIIRNTVIASLITLTAACGPNYAKHPAIQDYEAQAVVDYCTSFKLKATLIYHKPGKGQPYLVGVRCEQFQYGEVK